MAEGSVTTPMRSDISMVQLLTITLITRRTASSLRHIIVCNPDKLCTNMRYIQVKVTPHFDDNYLHGPRWI